MNIEPCVKFGIRISPKISEKPADSRNSRPPNVTLLTVSSSQNVIFPALALPDCYLLACMLREGGASSNHDRPGAAPDLSDYWIIRMRG